METVNPLVPQVARIVKIVQETSDIKTFQVVGTRDAVPFDFIPGQCAMLSLPPVGEALFSITSSPTCQECLEFSVKEAGTVTRALHDAVEGQEIGLRGPFGNGFPLDKLKGKDLLFIGGGIGLAPLRSLIDYCFSHRGDFGQIDIVYGARTPEDLIRQEEIFKTWPAQEGTRVHLTVDVEWEGWKGHVGFVPQYVEEIGFNPENKMTVTCGPPIMIKFVLQGLDKMGFTPDQIITTLELRMKCGVGKCGRCNIGDKYVCKDGPVFTLAELQKLPAEY